MSAYVIPVIVAYCVPTLCIRRTVLYPSLNTAYPKGGLPPQTDFVVLKKPHMEEEFECCLVLCMNNVKCHRKRFRKRAMPVDSLIIKSNATVLIDKSVFCAENLDSHLFDYTAYGSCHLGYALQQCSAVLGLWGWKWLINI